MSSVSAINSLLSSTSTSSTSAIDLSSILQASTGSSSGGIDVTAAVNASLYAARGAERVWQAQQTALNDQTASLQKIESAVTQLTNDMQSLNSVVGPLSARSVSSSNSAVVTGSAVSSTAVGNHSVLVNSIAQTAAWYSDVVGKSTDNVPAGSFTISAGSGSITVDTTTTPMTLGNVVDLINQQAAAQNVGLQARIVTDTTGSRLAVVSTQSGAAGNFTISAGSYPASTTDWTSGSVASSSTKLTPGTFTLSASGGSASLTVTGTDTLDTLAQGINSMKMGVTATVVTDTAGAHLEIANTDSSSTSKFTISRDPTAASMGFTQSVTGADAQFSVDGIPTTSASNTVTSPAGISGLTLNLQGANPSSMNYISVAPDTSQVAAAINQFVTDYNSAISQVNSQFVFSASNEGALSNDPTVRSLQASLLQAIGYVKPSWGIPPVTPPIATLGSMGISMGQDGTLSVNSTTLNSVLQSNFSDVQNFFQGQSLDGFANSLDKQLGSFTDPANGAFTVDLQSINAVNTDLQSHISDFESNYINPLQVRLQSQFSKAEVALQQLPQQMQQLNAMLGFNNKSGS